MLEFYTDAKPIYLIKELNDIRITWTIIPYTVTKQKSNDVPNGHLDSKYPFDIDIPRTLMNSYIQKQQERTKKIYRQLLNQRQVI